MNYDISTVEDCCHTLQSLTGFNLWDDLYDMYKYHYQDNPDKIRDIIIEHNKLDITANIDNFYFNMLHVTTSANGCADIKQHGLNDLSWALNHNTELKKFLNDNAIFIIESEHKMYIDSKEYVLAEKDVGFKLYRDKDICGSFQINKNSPYGGNVHLRPEILFNINKYVSGKDLEHIWYTTHIPYVVKFQVPYQNMDIALEMSIKDRCVENVLDKLLSYAMDTFFYRSFDSDKIGILKRNKFVPPEDILAIINY